MLVLWKAKTRKNTEKPWPNSWTYLFFFSKWEIGGFLFHTSQEAAYSSAADGLIAKATQVLFILTLKYINICRGLSHYHAYFQWLKINPN